MTCEPYHGKMLSNCLPWYHGSYSTMNTVLEPEVFANFHVGFTSRGLCTTSPPLPPLSVSPLLFPLLSTCLIFPRRSAPSNLYSEIKSDDSPVKGSKKGRGKSKDKKKAPSGMTPEKKKKKHDEMKVLVL